MRAPSRQEIITLRERGLTRDRIAEHFGVSVTTVRRWIKQYDIPRPTKNARNQRAHISKTGEIIAPLRDERTVLEKAIDILGPRFQDKGWKGYWLDGRPVNVQKIIHAAGLTPRKI